MNTKPTIYQRIGKILRVARKANKVSCNQVSERFKMRLTRYETASARMSLGQLAKLCKYYDLTLIISPRSQMSSTVYKVDISKLDMSPETEQGRPSAVRVLQARSKALEKSRELQQEQAAP